jgi:hypothetical protein
MLLDELKEVILTTEINSNDIPRSLGANFANIPYHGHAIHLIFVYIDSLLLVALWALPTLMVGLMF